MQTLVTDFEHHPWNWAAQVAADPHLARRYGGGSRWNAGKDLSFVPLRPDRDPRSCTYAQLDQPVAFRLDDIVPGLLPH